MSDVTSLKIVSSDKPDELKAAIEQTIRNTPDMKRYYEARAEQQAAFYHKLLSLNVPAEDTTRLTESEFLDG